MHVAFEQVRRKSRIFADFGVFSPLKIFGKELGFNCVSTQPTTLRCVSLGNTWRLLNG